MKNIACSLLCCSMLFAITSSIQALPKKKNSPAQNHSTSQGSKQAKREKLNKPGPKNSEAVSTSQGFGNDGGSTSATGAAYFYSSDAFRVRNVYPDGTLLLVSEIKGYDWNTKQYYDVLEKVELIGLRRQKAEEVCAQEYLKRLQQLVAAELLHIEDDRAVQPSDPSLRPAYLWTKDGQLINLQVIREGYVAALALDSYAYQEDFLAEQDIAQQQQRGIWGTAERCTATPLPTVFPASNPFADDKEQGCKIKGLIGSGGALKYCLSPGDKNYEVISVRSTKGERWFCAKEEARKAGWDCY